MGSLGRVRRLICCKFGHSVGKVAIIGATITPERLDPTWNVMLMPVVLGERNEGMKGMSSPVMDHSSRVLRFGNNGSLTAQSC